MRALFCTLTPLFATHKVKGLAHTPLSVQKADAYLIVPHLRQEGDQRDLLEAHLIQVLYQVNRR